MPYIWFSHPLLRVSAEEGDVTITPSPKNCSRKFPFKQLKPFKRLFEDAVSQPPDLGDGLVDENEDAVGHG